MPGALDADLAERRHPHGNGGLERPWQNGDLLEFGWRTLERRGNLEVFAVMHEWTCPRLLYYLQALSEARPLALHRDAKGGELIRSIPRPETEHQPSARHQVEGGCIFGDAHRMGEGQDRKHPNADTPCGTSQHPSDDKRGGALPIDGKMILGH